MPHEKVPPLQRANARRMRRTTTEAELKLWNELRAHRLMGLSFRRQMPIMGYIVDFACPSRRLIVEIDGVQYAGARAGHDAARTARLEAEGWTVVRFWNVEVLRDADAVSSHILAVTGDNRP